MYRSSVVFLIAFFLAIVSCKKDDDYYIYFLDQEW